MYSVKRKLDKEFVMALKTNRKSPFPYQTNTTVAITDSTNSTYPKTQ